MSALNHALGLLDNDAGNLYMVLGGLVKGRCNDLGLYAAGHIGNLLRTLVDEQHYHVSLRMVGGYRVCYILEQYGLTGLRLSHDQGTLSLADRSEHVNHAGGEIVILAVAQGELLIREQRSQVLERNAVTCN